MASKGYATLARPVRIRPVLKYLGELCVALAGIAAVPCVVAITAGWREAAARFAVIAVALIAVGWLLSRFKAEADIRPNEALVITCSTFIIGALAMTWLLMVAGVDMHDAFFESVSGITTTGLSTIPGDTELPAVHLFTRAWMQWQWYGGMAIIVLAVGLLLPPGAISKGMAAGGAMPEGMVGSARLRARVAGHLHGFVRRGDPPALGPRHVLIRRRLPRTRRHLRLSEIPCKDRCFQTRRKRSSNRIAN